LYRRYQLIKKDEATCETYMTDDAKLIVVAFGIGARIAKGAIKNARAAGRKVGLFRPITLWPFPTEKLQEMEKTCHNFLDFELNMGQMLEDVQLSLSDKANISFYGRPGGVTALPDEILRVITRIYHQNGLDKKK